MFPILNTAPSRSPPLLTWALIAANSLVFLNEQELSPDELEAFLRRFALIPGLYFTPNFDLGYAPSNWEPFFTNMFLHGGWLHLILTCGRFGCSAERSRIAWAPPAISSSILPAGSSPRSPMPSSTPTSTEPALGASGAIAGVMGCYMRLFPWARIVAVIPVLFFPFFFELPALVVIGFWFADSGSERRGGSVHDVRERRRSVLGAHRRLPRRLAGRSVVGALGATLSAILRR